MKFLGTPNLLIRVNKNIPKTRSMKHFRFDTNGFYETDNPRLIKLLSRRFTTVEEDNTPSESINEEATKEPENKTKVFKCNKCEFETTNRGELLAHYRNHKKEV